MKTTLARIPGILAAMALLFVSTGASDAGVRTRGAEPPVSPGLYTVVLYGQDGPHDPETAAFLDREDDGVTIRPYGAEFRWVLVEHVEAAKAAETARSFVERMINLAGVELKEILGPDGASLGYEFRPVFAPFIFGATDLLLISYVEKAAGRITVYVGLHPSYEPSYRTGGNGFEIP